VHRRVVALVMATWRALNLQERAILFEREKRAEAQHERRHSTAGTIELNRYASLPA